MSRPQTDQALSKPLVNDELIQEIVSRVLIAIRPERIILFGSAATGRMTHDSDIDLLILERDADELRELAGRVHDTLAGLGFPFDVIVMPSERFEETKNVIGGIAYPAHKYGKVIYEVA